MINSPQDIAAKKQQLLQALDGWLGLSAEDPSKASLREAIDKLPDIDDDNGTVMTTLNNALESMKLDEQFLAMAKRLSTLPTGFQQDFIEQFYRELAKRLRERAAEDPPVSE